MTRKRARLYMVLALLVGVGVATMLVFMALGQNVSYFRTPTEIIAGAYPEKQSGRSLRLGGMVEKGSLTRQGSAIDFRITDMKHTLPVHYEGIVPDLFREGQGVIATGKMDEAGVFQATVLLAKHDEKYMPPEVAREMKDAGYPQDSSKEMK